MCGIIGGWAPERIDDEALQSALENMRHRGPDDSGIFRAGSAFLGMRRLSIIDLAGGRQPISNEDGSVTVVCNGEIYNYRELREELKQRGHRFSCDSDVEVLVHLYEEYGHSLCKHLRGMFAFALWDQRRQRLVLGRDRFGKKPLYYFRTPSGGILCASELKSLMPLANEIGFNPSIRDQSVYDYLSFGSVPQPATIYRGVYTLPPACAANFDGKRLDVEPYWRLDCTEKVEIPRADALEQTRELLRESVRIRLRSDVPLGVFLSAGVDSTVVAIEAARQVGANLQTFTVSVDDPHMDESQTAARTAARLGVQHTILPLRVAPAQAIAQVVCQYDQPFADPSAIPSLAISQLAREHVTVVLNGDGGDEVFAGYRRHLAARAFTYLRWMPEPLLKWLERAAAARAKGRRSTAGFLQRLLHGATLPDGERYLRWTTDRLGRHEKAASWKRGRMRESETLVEQLSEPHLSALDTQLTTDIRINLLSSLLVKMDMATMAHSIEARSPLLDHKLAEFQFSLPDHYRIRCGRLKSMLRDAYRQEAPQEVLHGRKRGFEIPLHRWVTQDLKEVLWDTVGSSTARVKDYLDAEFVDGMLGEAVPGSRNWATTVYSLLVLELWLRSQAEVIRLQPPVVRVA